MQANTSRPLEHIKQNGGRNFEPWSYGNACVTGSGGLQTAGRGAPRLAIERRTDAQSHKGRDCVASGGLETAPPCRTRSFVGERNDLHAVGATSRALGIFLAFAILGLPGLSLRAGEISAAATATAPATGATAATAAAATTAPAPAQTRESFDFGWRFAKGDFPNAAAAQPAFDDRAAGWRALDLPHDWSIEGPYDKNAPSGNHGGYLPTGIGWYRKTFRLPESARGKIITIQFDGVYENSTVWLNGHELGTQPYGYTTFEYDLTPRLVFGARDNVLAVRVDNSRQPNSRWYSGSGIYRHTWLRTAGPLHIPTWGVCVTTPEISRASALVRARVQVRNDAPAPARDVAVTLAILDATGAIVAQGRAKPPAEPSVNAPGSSAIAPGATQEFTADLTLPRPQLWSPDTPNLYRLRATVIEGRAVSPKPPNASNTPPASENTKDIRGTSSGGLGETALPDNPAPTDTAVTLTTFGVRSLEFNLDRGFLLNGKKLIIRGMAMHHEEGAVGAAVPDAMLRRRLLLMKEMGCNAIRTSHNPAAPELYDLCDELGLLVLSEVFDEWTLRKGQLKFGYSDYYKDWHERDLTAHLRQTRNHPSVFMWSAGNEIDEQNSRGGDKVLRELVAIFHREDPTRPVTAGVSRAFTDKGRAPVAFTDLLDVVGYNYVDRWGARRETLYADDRSFFPARKFIGTEDASAGKTRGDYAFGPLAGGTRGGKVTGPKPPAAKIPAGALYPSATLRAEALWKFNSTRDYVEGYFTWTGFDFLGESSWPRKLSSAGALDTCGFKKDAFYFYQSIWTTKPMIHLIPHWNWPGREGQIIPVLAFTNANYAELFLNGRSLGVKAKEFPRQGAAGGFNTYARPVVQAATSDLHLAWDVPYEPGELRAVAYDIDGNITAETRVRTSGPPAALELTADRPALAADARDVAHITVRALDAKGVPVPVAGDKITFEITGPGKLIGVDNGNPASHENYKGATRYLFAGMALALVQTETQPGVIKLTARAAGLRPATLEITTR